MVGPFQSNFAGISPTTQHDDSCNEDTGDEAEAAPGNTQWRQEVGAQTVAFWWRHAPFDASPLTVTMNSHEASGYTK